MKSFTSFAVSFGTVIASQVSDPFSTEDAAAVIAPGAAADPFFSQVKTPNNCLLTGKPPTKAYPYLNAHCYKYTYGSCCLT